MIHHAREIAKVNGLSEKITFVQSKVEEAKIPTVDIIISEWMGFCLLSEIMLDSLLVARDKFLAPGGLLFPDRTSLHLAAIEDGAHRAAKIDCRCSDMQKNSKLMRAHQTGRTYMV